MQDYYPIIFYAGGFQGFILAVFLISIKVNRIANRILGLLTFCWGVLLLVFGLQFDGFFMNNPHFLKTFSHLPLLFFPLLFLYVKYLITRREKFSTADYLHFVPFLISILIYTDFYFKSGLKKIAIAGSTTGFYYTVDVAGDIFLAFQGIIYSIIVILALNRYSRQIKNFISNTDRLIITTIARGTYLLLISWIIGSVAVSLELFDVYVSVDLFVFVYLLIVIVIYWISYLAIKSPEVFKLNRNELFNRNRIEKKTEEDYSENLNQQLLEYLRENKPYLEAELSLQDLADMLTVSRHQLSALINGTQQKNFYEFINHYRVEEVKILMKRPENKHLKIMSLAYDAGFNSKATFNRIFRQFTDMTPSQYQALQS
jgi:AraC-like DNA-binding protein